jgi:hypothetical protein
MLSTVAGEFATRPSLTKEYRSYRHLLHPKWIASERTTVGIESLHAHRIRNPGPVAFFIEYRREIPYQKLRRELVNK